MSEPIINGKTETSILLTKINDTITNLDGTVKTLDVTIKTLNNKNTTYAKLIIFLAIMALIVSFLQIWFIVRPPAKQPLILSPNIQQAQKPETQGSLSIQNHTSTTPPPKQFSKELKK